MTVIYATWSLPKGDPYVVMCDKERKHYYSIVKREDGYTPACNGTPYFRSIRQHYYAVRLAQEDVMKGKYAEYWKKYRERTMSRATTKRKAV